ncbi:MAG: ATP-dependent DNA ligase [Candidatus Aenigmarchaeota archaeon]|nr:ATP-dependent DNA ligase [Candidatus Aenigmarchaeota archaeon]
MKFSDLVGLYKKLEATPKKLEKTEILAEFYKKCSEDDLYKAVVLSMGTVFPRGDEDLGIADGMIKKVISKVTGYSNDKVINIFKTTGDLGLTAEKLMQHRKQKPLTKRVVTIDLVFDDLRGLPELTGAGSQERKIDLVSELMTNSSPEEAKYIVRICLSQMRIGVAAGLVRDAIAKAFDQDKKEVEHIYNLVGDYGSVAEKAKKGHMKAEIEIGKPINVMLADRGGSDVVAAVKEFEKAAIETKYDGFRCIIHKDGEKIKVFSRRLEDVTKQFPDIVKYAAEALKAKQCIVDGEAVAYDYERNRTLAFQKLSRRIQRKYDIEKTVKEIPVQVNLFDIIYLEGESMMDLPLTERWPALKKIIKETKSMKLATHLETKDGKEAEKFYENALKDGQEGVIVKNMEAKYQPGRRVGYWVKVKPIMEPLDLVITGAEWGEGKRAKWLSSMILACKAGNKFLETGKMASGFTEDQLEELTKKLKSLTIETKGKEVKVKPEVVVEIGYEEIQASSKYESGYALRFPRLLRIRDASEKGPADADTLQTIEKLYKLQRGRKK